MSSKRLLSSISTAPPSHEQLGRIRRGKRLPKSQSKQPPAASLCETFFSADTSYGQAGLRVSVPVQGKTARSIGAVSHALSLGVVEEKIQFIENWLRFVLDLKFSVCEDLLYAKVFTILDKSVKGDQVSLYLPVEYWHLIPQFPESEFPLSQWDLEWAKYPATFRLSNLVFQEDEVSMITDKSLILLPESYASPWEVELEISDLNRRLKGIYSPERSHWTSYGLSSDFKALQQQASEGIEDDQGYTKNASELSTGKVECAEYVPSKLLIPSIDQSEYSLNQTLANMIVKLVLDDRRVFSGNIGSVASGYGLFINREVIL